MATSASNSQHPDPPLDYGFFGPDSIVWKVFRHPTSVSVGFQRTVVTEMFEPFLLASVADTEAVKSRTASRYDRTLQYVSTVAFADSETVVKAADMLYKIHSNIRGIEPISGGTYDANDPESQLWIHLTQWHSVLLCYETFGPGKLTADEEAEYWQACRLAADFQTIDPETVPRNREEMRAYYERMRPKLAVTEDTLEIVDLLLDASVSLVEDAPLFSKPFRPPIRLLFRKATIATLPPWMRRLAGIRQSRFEDAAVIAALRLGMWVATLFPEPWLLPLVKQISPGTAKVVAQRVLEVTPQNSVVKTPQQAWQAAGRPMPRQQYEADIQTRPATPPKRAPRDAGTDNLLQFA